MKLTFLIKMSSTKKVRFKSLPLNPLSATKATRQVCEICEKQANVCCGICKKSYYCSLTHQKLDYTSIHHKICPLIAALRDITSILGSKDEREKRLLTLKLSKHIEHKISGLISRLTESISSLFVFSMLVHVSLFSFFKTKSCVCKFRIE